MLTPEQRTAKIAAIRDLPSLLSAAVAELDDAQLDTRSAVDAWTIRQLVHHVADSHLNSFLRVKLLLTEEQPTVKAYDQDAWAELPDTTGAPVELSLALLRALHARWALLFERVPEASWSRTALHPENGVISLDDILTSYARHGADHIAQIRRIRAAEGW